jgi:hypothetical protein
LHQIYISNNIGFNEFYDLQFVNYDFNLISKPHVNVCKQWEEYHNEKYRNFDYQIDDLVHTYGDNFKFLTYTKQ